MHESLVVFMSLDIRQGVILKTSTLKIVNIEHGSAVSWGHASPDDQYAQVGWISAFTKFQINNCVGLSPIPYASGTFCTAL